MNSQFFVIISEQPDETKTQSFPMQATEDRTPEMMLKNLSEKAPSSRHVIKYLTPEELAAFKASNPTWARFHGKS